MRNNNNIKFFEMLVSRTKIYLVIIAILLIVLCIYKPTFIVPAIIIYILIIAYTFWANKKRRTEISEKIQELTFKVDNASKSSLVSSPFPLIIVETTGEIVWESPKFTSEFKDVKIYEILNKFIKELKLEIENSGSRRNNKIHKKLEIKEKQYKVVGEYAKSKSNSNDKKAEKEYVATLYFVDETEMLSLEKNYNDSKICVGIVMIDNYDELMQRLSDEEKLRVITEIEKNILDWATTFEGFVVKSERDTFIWICEQKYLTQLEDKKFNILDTIKEINTPGKMQSTISIAVSIEGKSNYEKYKSAQAAIDIALGRGGDQAVIRKNGKYVFFGGRTQEVEKRTKVKARIVAHALEELIQEAGNVIIMGHTNGDIDSIGSSLGIYRIANKNGKQAFIVNETYGISLNNFMDTVNQSNQYEGVIINRQEAMEKIDANTLLVVVDTHKKSYVEAPELLDKTSKIVVIDHHRMSTDYIENATLSFQEVYASSAAELVTELIVYSESDIKLNEIEAESLYAGIMMDTKNFTFKTGVRTFEAAAFLRKCGVDIIKVKKWFQSDLNTYNMISKIVANSEIVKETIAISIYDESEKDANIICAKAADELLTISNITASFVIGNLGDKVCISGRSIGDINVQVILEKLGGGGHITLAGAQVEGKTINEVKKELIIKINEYFSEIV